MQIDMDVVQRGVIENIANSAWEDGKWLDYIRKDIDRRIDKLFAERVEEVVTAAINSAVNAGFDRTFQAVDTFGKPEGEPTTIRKRLNQMISDYWSERVDRNGKKTTDTYNSRTRAEHVMLSVCGDDFSKELRQHAVNTTAALKDGLRAELRGWVDRTLGEMFRVRTDVDKAGGRNL